ncbi:hypothetical protein FQZ97_958040 [compost metagenome]
MFQRIGVGADGVDVAGGVARAIALVPFLDHGERTGLLEERVQAVDDDDVQVEKQRAALQVVQRVGEAGQLEPAVAEGPGFALVELVKADRRDRLDFDGGIDALGIVGQTDETKWPVQVAPDHAVQFVDVFGAVFLAPLDAQHVDCLHRSPSLDRRCRMPCMRGAAV